MNYLLDTHTFIWCIIDPEKLPSAVEDVIKSSTHNIFVSAVSFWEISVKFSLNKLDLQGTLPSKLPGLSVQTGFKNIPLLPEECALYHTLKITTHKDPFDRMLIWQAITRQLTFITKDAKAGLYAEEGLDTFWK